MSSYVAAGPVIPISGPLPRPPRHRLLSVPGVLVEADPNDWRAGAAVDAYPSDLPELWAACEEGTFETKAVGDARAQPRFFTVTYYLPIMCGPLGNVDFDEFAEMAETVLRAVESYAIERLLVHGIVGSSNPHLADAHLRFPAGQGAVSPGLALSYLDDAIADSAREGLIHVTRAIANGLGAVPLGDDEGEPAELVTAAGTPIAVGDGYVDADPANGSSAAGDGTTDWAFATGPVEVRLSEEYRVEGWAEALDRATNEAIVYVERDALVIWDGVVQAGVLVDWAT